MSENQPQATRTNKSFLMDLMIWSQSWKEKPGVYKHLWCHYPKWLLNNVTYIAFARSLLDLQIRIELETATKRKLFGLNSAPNDFN